MSFNGAGVFNRLYNWVADKAANIKVNATRMDAEMDGFATGLSTAITKDGQTTITANIPFANNKITGLGAATATTDAATLAQVQSQASNAATVGGTADAITLTTSPTITAYAANQRVRFVATGTNTGAVTVARDGLAARAVQANGAALVAGDIVSGRPYELFDDGTQLQLFSSKAAVLHTADIADSAVSTGKIAASAITAAKVSDDAYANVASATTTDLGAEASRYLNITGITTITGFGTVAAGRVKYLKFAGALTLTHNATSLIIPGAANITTAAGDKAKAVSLGSGNWEVFDYIKASGAAIVASNKIINRYYAEYTTNADITMVLSADDTIPASTEGVEIHSVSVTTTTATQRVRVIFAGFGACGAAAIMVAAAFRDTTCIQVAATEPDLNSVVLPICCNVEEAPGSAATFTYSIRVGPGSANTMRLNGTTAGRYFGGASRASVIIEVIEP